MRTINFTVNGSPCAVSCPPAKTLLDVLREDLKLTASKECCGKGECGSCSVLLNGEVVCSCLILAGQVENQEIVTCEGVGLTSNMDVIQESFVVEGATQCGYCTPGIIVSARAFLNGIDYVPSTDQIKTALGGNLCRCTGYTKIIKAIQTAAEKEKKIIGNVTT
ncbi:(2Fe-2S)-binding protein [Bacillus sp. DTU_2020_1000418_1_SI_GHA_SEK_038]|uniref:(2Fe-2S)-binding protein n=1 Tax=Bacillus sp. DTU_2020_1000418_1_SI_GHA_SEK_038 TaxID=3077585 RepID=UPI0028EEC2F7|nr:2Fe-2S iron-sulfur cluster-binding protein [Bacillus sp. DTU_2020_1000418_1_SI_GHA_SEK_038]WNS77395.1 (2Fe-2S)-binding protein [Bacillus sp. DTU_2020_1000418_1_SI_GHA_SEK_038]